MKKQIGIMVFFMAMGILPACAHKAPPETLYDIRAEIERAENKGVGQFLPEQLAAAEMAYEKAYSIYDTGALASNKEHYLQIAKTRARILTIYAEEAELRNQVPLAEPEMAVVIEELPEAVAEIDALRSDLEAVKVDAAQIRETERGLILSFSNVLFAFDQDDIKAGSQRNLKQIADVLEVYPQRVITIEGHTDNIGNQDYNVQLSRRRAEAVKNFFQGAGVPVERLQAQGLGDQYPVATNATPEGRQQNRRVDIVIQKDDENS